MSTEQKRAAILKCYPGGNWVRRVEQMSDAQIHSVYMRLMNAGKIKG